MPVISRFFESERLEMAKEKLCQVFGIAALREHQIKAGENIISGTNTLYDIPTGGGKTLIGVARCAAGWRVCKEIRLGVIIIGFWFWNCLLCTPSASPSLLCSHSLQFLGDRARGFICKV
ncbi:hypothetical protein K435DRAFT_780176 [Dendrothele bispora CBS 962.96]|uniref:DEAD/DEAH box helicase domain-containing protein n=1 Tax=Dendrothele bispora (strain CBS 962.96) TaxID=1314807 RepID=A0A4S8LM09_DENBC|nr:hypothetical protein K435DRAFT_785250 [Dendrothele bispora CBS 962.96]THU82788.1 hypothetical protein K435DRAFT_784494 [Dendrothele bispora CBS 962.96]THU90244.1 hypothetical protein K435DRAFT_781325 [Dendrothele bispora CBS 962.96]THU92619.1 hypothetical protein K435DRAFT_780176 [Dendrothele bispora CBS 962.96]